MTSRSIPMSGSEPRSSTTPMTAPIGAWASPPDGGLLHPDSTLIAIKELSVDRSELISPLSEYRRNDSLFLRQGRMTDARSLPVLPSGAPEAYGDCKY